MNAKKQNQGIVSGFHHTVIRFHKSNWTLKGVREFLSKNYSNLKWKRSPEWDPNGEEHYVFTSDEIFTREVNKFGQTIS